MPRHLNIAAEILPALGTSMLAQIEAVVDDPDNLCCVCGHHISGPSAEVVLFTDGEVSLAKLADSDCTRSGICQLPGVRQGIEACAENGFDMLTRLTARDAGPRALLFLEPTTLCAGPDQDPLELYAEALGLAPISGRLEEIEAPATDAFTIGPTSDGLELRLSGNSDWVEASPTLRREWLELTDGRALVIVARGLGLARAVPTIEEAVALRPAWGGVARVST
jgi:hypothetical protein